MILLISEQQFSKIQNLRKLSGFIFFLTCLILNTGCFSDEKHYPFQGQLREFVHQNGLIIKLPDTLAAKENDNGFLIEPANESDTRLRNSVAVWIEKRENEELVALANTRQFGDRTISYQIERNDGGSGGDEYNFTAWEKIDQNLVVYKQTQQSEYGEPDFSTCWQIIEKIAIKK